MSDSASDRPSGKTHQPYSTLESRSARQTGPRPKASDESDPRQTDPRAIAPDEAPETSEAFEAPAFEPPEKPSVPPEALRKPFSSLAPQKPVSLAPSATVSESPVAPAVRAQPSRPPVTASRPASRPVRSVCQKHGLAKNGAGECLLCQKEQKGDSNRGWKLIVALMVLAIGGGTAAALIL